MDQWLQSGLELAIALALVLGAHALRLRFSLAPLYALLGCLTAVMWLVSSADVRLTSGPGALLVGPQVYFPVLLVALFCLYVFDGSQAAWLGVFTIVGVTLLLPLLGVLGHTVWAENVGFTMAYVRPLLASGVSTALVLVWLGIAWEYLHQIGSRTPTLVRVLLVLISALWLDWLSFTFIGTAGRDPAMWGHLRDGMSLRLAVGVGLAPILSLYLRLDRKRHGGLVAGRPLLAILRSGTMMDQDLISARRELQLRKRAEAALRDSQQRLAEAQHIGGLGSWDWPLSHHHAWWSDQMYRLLGLNPGQVVASTDAFIGYVHPEDRERVRVAFERTATDGGTLDLELRIIRPDGQVRHVHTIGRLEGAPDDPERKLTGTALDITERKRAEAALRASEEKWRNIVQAVPMGMLVYELESDNRLVLVDANPATDRLLGIDHRPLLGRHIEDIFPGLADTPIPRTYRQVATTGVPWRGDRVDYNHGGIKGSYEVYAFQVTTGRMAVLFLEISARLATEEERRRLEEQMQQAQKMESLGILAGGIAHDFNNLLTGIVGNLSLARLYLAEDNLAELEPLLAEVEVVSLRASTITQQLLTFSRGGAPVRRLLDSRTIVRDALHFAMHGAKHRYEMDLATDLWPVEADAGQLNQVISNLVINARQAMPNGGTLYARAANLTLTIPGQLPLSPGRYITLSFRDEGHGIPPEVLPRIFDPFFTTKAQGRGLGLATAFSIIKRHEGHIAIDSVPGQGATFTIYLPAAAPDAVAPVADAAAPPAPAGSAFGRLLVMDDEQVVLTVVGNILDRLGYDVTTAHNGEEAVRLYDAAQASGRPFRAAILDLTVRGGMGGEDAARAILALAPNAILVASTGYSNDAVMSDCRAHGFRAAVAKPYQATALGETLTKVLTAGG